MLAQERTELCYGDRSLAESRVSATSSFHPRRLAVGFGFRYRRCLCRQYVRWSSRRRRRVIR
jgi:hypothetical protein